MTNQNSDRSEYGPVEILLVEDNSADVRLTREALTSGRLLNNLNVAKDGVEAMAYLRQEGTFAGATRPDLVLLDLNLPKKDGYEVLAEIKADENLKLIPVVVLTTSTQEEDILEAYRLHASCYINKPRDLHQFMKVVKSIEDYWFTIVKLPPRR
jgi:chemotaxis family two-component system response regulator Rcp1